MPSTALSPLQLKDTLASGLLTFPVSCFDADLAMNESVYAEHVSWLCEHEPAALFAAGGTGEFFSLLPEEVIAFTKTAKSAAGTVPVLAGCGYGTEIAVRLAKQAEAAGADGLLLLPHYLVGAEQDGLFAHIRAVCDAVGIGVVMYNRDNSIATLQTISRLAESCPNLIGYKDGVGDLELVTSVTTVLGDRLTYIGGMPTHEGFASAYFGAGVSTYSSAVFNFVPALAQRFFGALRSGDQATVRELLQSFFIPLAEIRRRRNGYAVSMIKAGVRLIGRDPGAVRPPLVELAEGDLAALAALLDRHDVPKIPG